MTVNAGFVWWLFVATSILTIIAFVCYCLLGLYLKAKQRAYSEAVELHKAARIALGKELFPDKWAAYKQAHTRWRIAQAPLDAAYEEAMRAYETDYVNWSKSTEPMWFGGHYVYPDPTPPPVQPSREYLPEPAQPLPASVDDEFAKRRQQGLLKLPDIPNSWGCRSGDGDNLTEVLLGIWSIGLFIAMFLGVIFASTYINLVPE